MRRVQVFKYELDIENRSTNKVYSCDATFHKFGVSYNEFEGGIDTAIIEFDNGEVTSISLDLIKFINK